MNLQEFAALKVDDKIENPSNGFVGGVVSAVEAGSVRVRWGVSPMDFAYSVQGTAWFHWSKVPPQEPNPDGIA